MILTAGGDDGREARVWDAETFKPVTGRVHHDTAITAAKFADGGRLIFTARANRRLNKGRRK